MSIIDPIEYTKPKETTYLVQFTRLAICNMPAQSQDPPR